MTRVPLVLFLCVAAAPLYAAQLTSVSVLDQDYLVVQISDGDVTHNENPSSETVSRYPPELNTSAAVSTANWTITSSQDGNYGGAGRQPTNVYRKTKLSGHGQMEWTGSDFRYEYTYQHWIFLRLPSPMQQGMTYTVTVGSATNATPTSGSVTFDIYNRRSEAVHVNLVGYVAATDHKAADLYAWLGNGGARDYSSFEGSTVYLYNVGTGQATAGRHGDLLEAERPRRLLVQPDALRRLERRLPGFHQPRHLPPRRPGRRLQPGLHDREQRLRESLPGLAPRLLLHAHRAGQPDGHLPAAAHAPLHPRLEPREHRRLSHDRHPVRAGLGPDPDRPVGPTRRLGALSQARKPDEPQRVRGPLRRRRLGPPPRDTCRSSTTCCCPTSSRAAR